MVQPAGYSDIALSFSPEAFYTGIPGADVSRGMLYGQGKAEKLHADTRLQMELTEKERQFNESLAEKVREYDESMGFGKEQFNFFKEQYADQYGLQKDYLKLSRDQMNKGSGSGFDMNAFLDRMEFGKGPSLTPFDRPGVGLSPGIGATRYDAPDYKGPLEDYGAESIESSYYNPFSGESISDRFNFGGEPASRNWYDEL
ncbi:MAG: hypothetical protein ACYSWP_07570 [Planctomycetota bacterium]|jgi:hypothetical protein